MTDMIERVALAIWEAGRRQGVVLPEWWVGPERWEGATKAVNTSIACAAIRTLRDHLTDDMIDAFLDVEDNLCPICGYSGQWDGKEDEDHRKEFRDRLTIMLSTMLDKSILN